MKDQLRKYNVAFTKTAAENEKLKEKNKTLSASLDKAKEGSVLKRLEDAKLRQDYEAALKTLDSIPPEVIRFYENRSTQEPVVRHDKDSDPATMEVVTQTNAVKSPTNSPETTKLVYTVKEVAQMLAISQRAAYNLCNSTTEFRVLRAGGSIRIPKDSFDAWLYRAA